jgi:glycosyltransferase involved in cell wall biosynthesis
MPNTDFKLSGLPLGLEFELKLSTSNEPSITGLGAELLTNLVTASAPSLDRTFLTVLMRTQGKRINALRDSLTTLYGQTSQDFVVFLIEHDVSVGTDAAISEVIDSFPQDFSGRIYKIRVQGGSRARPLNEALDTVESSYVAALDDDDIVFANWVEEFKRGAIESPGRMIRALCAVQKVQSEEWFNGTKGFRAMSWPEIPYEIEYSQIEHLRVNQSPFMSIAFPVGLFTVLGERFDEELAVCEDWDMILRGGAICGVHQIPSLTAIYRNWVGVETSYTQHSFDEWRISEARVLQKLSSRPFLLETGAVEELRKLVLLKDTIDAYGTYDFMFRNGVLRLPFRIFFRAVSPAIRLAVRARNLLRRLRGRKP